MIGRLSDFKLLILTLGILLWQDLKSWVHRMYRLVKRNNPTIILHSYCRYFL